MLNGYPKLNDVDVEGKRVLVRVGMDVSLDADGNIIDDNRIVTCIPTIQNLVERKAKIILLLHIGRPGGKVIDKLKTDRIADRLSRFMHRHIEKIDGVTGEEVKRKIDEMKEGDIVFLDNVRFHPGEEANDEKFAMELASLGDVYINECFSVSHRKHVSLVGLPKHLPSAIGYCLENEINALGNILQEPERPFVVLLGGTKADKLNMLKPISDKADAVLVGGGLSFIFMKMLGQEIGNSECDSQWMTGDVNDLKEMMSNGNIVLPKDFVVAKDMDAKSECQVVARDSIGKESMALDIGPETIKEFKKILGNAKTVVWAGPMGAFEMEAYSNGTKEIADFISKSDSFSIIGGGESVFALEKFKVIDSFNHVSTGGGAFLKFLSKGTLPALEAIGSEGDGSG